jgi:hypothetical protein
MQFDQLIPILLAIAAWLAVIAFGIGCAWIAGKRRTLRSVGRVDGRQPFPRNFYALFTRQGRNGGGE